MTYFNCCTMRKPITFALMRGNWLRQGLGLHQQEIDGRKECDPLGTLVYFWDVLAPSNEMLSCHHWLCLPNDFSFILQNIFWKFETHFSIKLDCSDSGKDTNIGQGQKYKSTSNFTCKFQTHKSNDLFSGLWSIVFWAAGYAHKWVAPAVGKIATGQSGVSTVHLKSCQTESPALFIWPLQKLAQDIEER